MQLKSFSFFTVLLVLTVAFVDATPLKVGDSLKKGKGSNNNAAANSATTDTSAVATSTASDSSTDNSASGTGSAASAARTRPCDQGDQSLAAALQANVIIGLGLQASVVTLQGLGQAGQAGAASSGVNAADQSSQSSKKAINKRAKGKGSNNAASASSTAASADSTSVVSSSNDASNSSSSNFSADFQAGVDRLNQFLKTSALQIQAAQAIADDDSFAQPQLALLADQSAQQNLIGSLTGDPATDNATLASLLDSFVKSTGDSQDGASNALIDCFLPLTAVSA